MKWGQSTQTIGFLSQNHPWTLWFNIICSHVATNMVMKLTKPHGLTSGNQTRQWRILPGFSQLVPPFRLASPGHVWLAKGNWLRGTKACSLDWSQVSGCLDRTWTVGPGRNLPWLGMVEIAPIKMGDDLGMALFCVYLIFYCPFLSLVTITVVMSMIDFHGHRSQNRGKNSGRSSPRS